MITFNEWADFNATFYSGDIIVKVFRKSSYKQEDKELEVLTSIETARKFFGHYFVSRFNTCYKQDSNYQTLGFILWPESIEKK